MSEAKQTYLEQIDRIIKEIKYGTVTIIIQDGQIIQIAKTEKIRLK